MNDTIDRDEAQVLRLPPHSAEAEQSVLGGLLADNRGFDRIGSLLTEADFYRHEHRSIFTAIAVLIAANKPADVLTVFDAMGDKAAEFGGLTYLNQLAQSVPSAANVRRYAEIVRERSLLRQVLAKISDAGEIIHGEGNAGDKIDRIAALFSGLESKHGAREPQSMETLMLRVIDRVNEAADGKVQAWRTGLPGLDDRMLGGFKAGQLVILAARPSVGKTSVAMQFMRRVAQDGYPSLVLSQEMTAEDLGLRALSSVARVDLGRLQTGKANAIEWDRIPEGVEELRGLPMWVDDEPALTLRAIASKARKVRGLRVLAVDYLQLCDGDGDTRTAQVGSISRGLKSLAKQMGICIVALSQLNRIVETRPSKRPILSDLRDSGELEQDADTILFLWPLAEETDGTRPTGLEIAKNRQGRTGALVLEFFGATQHWGESMRTIESFSAKPGRSGGFE
jgi:replicative DNA helicase